MTEAKPKSVLSAPATIGFVGLGQMGLPMARRLIQAGYTVRAADLSGEARAAIGADGAEAFASARAAAEGAAALITMLPSGAIVREALLAAESGAASNLPAGALVIDMSSSAPTDTLALDKDLAARGISLIDAPVSGGVRLARTGELSIMAGGPAADVERARPLLAVMGKAIFATGPLGSGHAMKALNNYVNAAGLVAAIEALRVGQAFGLAPDVIVDVLNASTGRNNSTDKKIKQFVVSGSFASGFSMALMAKDIRIAADLASRIGVAAPDIETAAALWEKAAATLGKGADHTEIFRFLAAAGR